jgi:hypothetical protein
MELTYNRANIVAYDLRPFLTGNWDDMSAHHWGVIAGIVTYTVSYTDDFRAMSDDCTLSCSTRKLEQY